ncbi:MAG: OB-fold nucleic acid binding domain-containing protein, partial [Clostridia bacterium]|nr:OB-fold nucleic acid binding domain-containing protein [Clostridia bacterium]
GSYNGARQVAAGATATIVSYVGVEDALALPDGESVVVKGTVSVAGEWSDKYGNMNATITDESGKTLDAFRLATKVAEGDVVIITGKMGSYNGARQVAAGATAAIRAAE